MSHCSDGLSSDQYFLVNFIMSNYLGPDVYSDNPRCSASRRLAKGLPPYTLKHMGSSSLTLAQLQNLYYHVLRNAELSLVLHPDMIYMYLKGCLPLEPAGMFPQFTHFFPTNLHPHKRYSPSHEIVKGIVVVDDPEVAFITKEELQRFRCLSRLNDLKIDRVVSLSPRPVKLDESSGTKQQECLRNGDVTSNRGFNSSGELQEECKRKNEEETVAGSAVCVVSKTAEGALGEKPQSKGTDHDCSRNEEVMSNGVVTYQNLESSGLLQEKCARKSREEEVVVGLAVCITSETQEGISGDIPQSRRTEEHDCSRNEEVTTNGLVSVEEFSTSSEVRETCKRKNEEEEAVADHAVCGASKTPERFRETYKRKRFKNSSAKEQNKNDETDQSISLTLVPFSTDMKEKCETEPAVVTTGTASKGSSVGVVDIGVNKVAYFFQVALPGVRRDYGEFSCEVESDGKVILEGTTTTGEKTIKRHSRVFEMNIRKLCPPGRFKLCFTLPGPVDPRLFSPNFRSDGIFEAVIIRTQKS